LGWITGPEKQITGIENQTILVIFAVLIDYRCFPGKTAKLMASSPTGFGFTLHCSGEKYAVLFRKRRSIKKQQADQNCIFLYPNFHGCKITHIN
jgi:hypothetical protein